MFIVSRNYKSLRILIYLCGQPEFAASTREIAEALAISLATCRKRVSYLSKAGLLASERGYAGRVRLSTDPADTSIGDVVAAVEAQRSQRGAAVEPACKPLFERAAKKFLAELNRKSVRDLCPSCTHQQRARCALSENSSHREPARRSREPNPPRALTLNQE